MLNKIAAAIIRKVVSFGILGSLLLLVGYCSSDHKDYPGKAEFQQPNDLISNSSNGLAHGNTEAAKQAAEKFAKTIKPLQDTLFTGGSGRSFASGGNFLTYCQINPDSVVFMVHVPELRNYKDPETRELITTLAWNVAGQVARDLTFSTPTPEMIVGLRGFASYGPIWSGKRGGEPEVKTDDVDEVRRLYPYFVPRPQTK